MTTDVEQALARAFRDEWGQIVATLIRVTGDWDLAEECAQDAFTRALERWPTDGVPSRPGAWLTTTARNRAIDRRRRDAVGEDKLMEVARMVDLGAPDHDDTEEAGAIADDRLRLMFTCCHPALSWEAQVALALRTLAGLTTLEIARAFMVPEATMSKRLVRAKEKIRRDRIPYSVPPANELRERTDAVLGVLYLLFNEGYAASSGAALVRGDLCTEAIRLARLLVQLMPDEAEARGLLALMLLHDARRASRTDSAGDLVPLEQQDRSQWVPGEISEGVAVLADAQRLGQRGVYQLQAAIVSCHATAASAAETDWQAITSLYDELLELAPSPVVELNRAIAVAMADGPEAGLALLDELDASGELADYHLLPAARADLLRRLGRFSEAAESYRASLDRASSDADRRYLQRRLSEVSGNPAKG